ncbi:NfeD family protein [Limibacter armeniacum]|uniref:NfeD family protein n=1 Tax=Limibacter armeniacum TaxID=466084 RepID=UPI002FE5C8E6
MGELITVFSLVGVGVILMIVEFFFIPGTTVAGILGFLSAVTGVYLGYDYFGDTTGHLILLGTGIATAIAFIWSFRSNTWNRFALKDQITSKVNEDVVPLQVGDLGKTISALRPMGTAEFGGEIYEVRTQGRFLESGLPIRVERVESSKVFVTQI